MSTAVNTAAMRRIFDDVINRGDLDAADELFADEHELHPQTSGVGRAPTG